MSSQDRIFEKMQSQYEQEEDTSGICEICETDDVGCVCDQLNDQAADLAYDKMKDGDY